LNFINLSDKEREAIRDKVRDYIRREQSLEILTERLEKILKEGESL